MQRDIQALLRLRASIERSSFDGLLKQAPAALAAAVPGSQLELRPLTAATEPLQRGYADLPDAGRCFLDYYVGPPEPLQLIVTNLPDDTQKLAVLQLLMQELRAALQAAGFSQELRWLARRDWLTGLPSRHALERAIRDAGTQPLLLGLLELPAEAPDTPGSGQQAALRNRRIARVVRNELLDGESAFWLESGRFALLVPEGSQQRFRELLPRHVEGLRQAWAGLSEAPGVEVLKLLEARLFGQYGADPLIPEPPGPGSDTWHQLTVLTGSEIMKQLAEEQLSELHYREPLNLILDFPVGFALEALPDTSGRSLVVTGSTAHGYLLDLHSLRPHGLVSQSTGVSELRTYLQRVADGEEVYSGPLLKNQLLPRERDVWRLSAQGLDNTAIAASLDVSVKTVANYLSALQAKLGLASQTELVLAYWTSLES